MGIRETVNQNQGIATGVTIGIVVIALIVIVVQLRGGRDGVTPITRGYFTTDFGETWFQDAIERVPPFEHEGKEAVRVHMYSCDNGRTRFPGYLERYNPDALRRIEQARTRLAADEMDLLEEEMELAREYRKPGPEGQWVVGARSPDAATEVTSVRCPDGTTQGLRLVYP